MPRAVTTPNRFLCLVLGALVWASQWLLTVHELDHLAGHDEHAVCSLCLAAAGLDQPLAAQPYNLASPFPPRHSHLLFNPLRFVERARTVPARGPPL